MIDVTVKLPEAGAMMKKLGLDQRGEVQRVIAEEALGLCDSIVPFRSGMLKQSGHVENNGECIVWNQPYARYQYYGMLMVDKTTPRLIQFHILKNAVNPPFLGGFLIFGTVAA